MPLPVVDPVTLRGELDGPTPPRLLDVREPEELAVSRLDGVVPIPLGQLPARMGELDRDADWVVVCRSGARSAQATAFLLGQGFESVRNLAGGMKEYARTVDPSMAVA